MLVCDVNCRISWQQYFNHAWFSMNEQSFKYDKHEYNIDKGTGSKPINIPNKNNDNVIKSMPCFNNDAKQTQNANKYYDDIDYLLKDDYDEYYSKKCNKNNKEQDNTFIMDIDQDTDHDHDHDHNPGYNHNHDHNHDHNHNHDSDHNPGYNHNHDAKNDYIIINEEDLLLFDTIEYKPPSITSGMYNFLSNSIDKLKNNIRYFTY
jgi:hypothetical protein